jgi:predicted ATPase/DNA-binding winged helix-turn-helix (wHTH) protein
MDKASARAPAPTGTYVFAGFRLTPGRRLLEHGGEPVRLGRRAFDLLVVLVSEHGHPVSKDELFARVWPGLVVEENNLQVQVVALRKILGPDAIATMAGLGYQFTLPVTQAPDEAPAARSDSAMKAAPSAHRGAMAGTIGRDDELKTLRALIADHALVSIVGPGGIGKSHLARALVDAMRQDYADGVAFIELAPVSDPQHVVLEVARALALDVSGAGSPAVHLAEGLAGRCMLIVLDNCEHVLGAIAPVAQEIAARAPQVTLLVTSQEPLKLRHEQMFRIEGLATPPSEVDDPQRYGAVQLFLARVASSQRGFEPNTAVLTAIADICRSLDGIPLAIELAAARMPLLGAEGLRARLAQRFDILTGGSRFVLRRHQTLRATLDFSHSMLSAQEQAVFRRAGVFAATFTVDAAQQVCSDPTSDAWAVLDALGTLVDKSLLVSDGQASPRLHLLETMRSYALEKLAEAGQTVDALARHAEAVASFVSHTYDDYWSMDDATWLAKYEPELENIRAALSYAEATNNELAIQLLGDSFLLFKELALQPEVQVHASKLVTLISASTAPRAAGRLWQALAVNTVNTWPEQSDEAARKAVKLLSGTEDRGVYIHALVRLAALPRAPDEEQRDALRELERLVTADSPLKWKMLVRYAKGFLSRHERRFSEAREAYLASSTLAAEYGARSHATNSLLNVAEMDIAEGRYTNAIEQIEQLLDSLARGRDRLFYCFGLGYLATALLFAGRTGECRHYFTVAAPLIKRYQLAFRFSSAMGALCLAESRPLCAARLLGFARAQRLSAGRGGWLDANAPDEPMLWDCTSQELARLLDPTQLEQHMQTGAELSDDEACRIALLDSDLPSQGAA